jgi:hypothetical protein
MTFTKTNFARYVAEARASCNRVPNVTGRSGYTVTVAHSCCDDPDARVQERLAMAVIEGGIPDAYAAAFVNMQLTAAAWNQAVNDAGIFLDRWGQVALNQGWTASEVFGSGGMSQTDGLVSRLRGGVVVSLNEYGFRIEMEDGGLEEYPRRRVTGP